MKKKLVVSFSGGRTSAYMLWWIMNEWEDRHNWEIIVVFANTGKEAEGTLFFVDECAQEWDIPIVWVEGYPSEKGKGWKVNHKVVTYETAARKGEPFEAMIKRLGIPSTNAPFCSDQLKRKAIESYLKSIGWKGYWKAIGIRSDEKEIRVKKNYKKKRIFYFLRNENQKTKVEIINWFKKKPFDLNIHPDDGNCDNCWKKSDRHLVRNMVRKPNSFNWWEDMTSKYGYLNPRNTDLKPPFNFYRGNKSVADIREMAKMNQSQLNQLSFFDEQNPCEESCEAF